MLFLPHHYLSPTTILTLSCLLAVAGLIKVKAVDFYSALLMIVLSGWFFMIKEHVPPLLIFMAALSIPVYAIFTSRELSLLMHMIQFVLLGIFVMLCKTYFTMAILLHLAIMFILVASFLLLA